MGAPDAHGGGHHHGHAHPHGHGAATRRALLIALAANAAYTVVQAVAGLLAGSVALLADAGHNLSDVIALAIAAGASWLATRPATPGRSFGYKRAEVLAALVNATTLVVVATIVVVEALGRLRDPPPVPGGVLIVVALGGVVVNLACAALLMGGRHHDLNVRASYLHLAGDAAASLGVVLAGVLVLVAGWERADPVIAIVIAALIAASAWGVLRDSVSVLLEAAPRGIDPEAVGRAMAAHEGVLEVHDLHVWQIASGFPALSAHVVVAADEDCHARRRELAGMLGERFGIDHATLQVEHRQGRLLQVRPDRGDGTAGAR
jgi:cobalt-zinc-cadmium efflux system protein